MHLANLHTPDQHAPDQHAPDERPRSQPRALPRSLRRAATIGAFSLAFAFAGQSVASADPWRDDDGRRGDGQEQTWDRNRDDREGAPAPAPAPVPAPAPAPAPAPTPPASVPAGDYAHPCPACRLSQGFGGAHKGIDLAAPIGTPVHAAAAGTVTAAGPRDPGGFGQAVYIKHDDGTVAWYGHIDTWLVNVGEHVAAGQQIATVGNRGNSSGPHLHFAIHAPGAIDPASWLRQGGLSI